MEYLLILPFVLAYFLKGINRVRPNERGLIESRGTYSKFKNPGTFFVLPLFQRLVTVSTQEKQISVPINVTTEDDIICTTTVKVIFQVEPTENNVRHYFGAGGGFIKDLIISATNDIIGEISYKEIAEKREIICEFITKKIKKKCISNGLKICSVDLDTIVPPEEIQKANTKVVSKRREKEASKIEIETIKTKTAAKKQSDIEILEHKRKLINEEIEIKLQGKEKIKKKEQEIAKLLSEDLDKDLKKKKVELENIYKNVEKESLAQVLQDEGEKE